MTGKAINLKFVFANHDGVSVELPTTTETRVSAIKESLITLWPEKVEKCDSVTQFRLICMGCGILHDVSSRVTP